MSIQISNITNPSDRIEIVKEVLFDLPEWFGLPESTKAYIDEAKELTLLAAYIETELVGFITLQPSSEDCVEIHAMGVKKKYHRQGIGSAMYQAFETFVKPDYPYIQVKTVAEGHYKEYDQTIAFYQRMGFVKLEVFPTLWDEWNPCLVMVKKIDEK